MQVDRVALIPGKQEGYLWTWWKNDAQPLQPLLSGWHVETSDDINFLARLSVISRESVRERLQAGHRPYMAYLETTLVAYGWSAINAAAFGSPSVHFFVPMHNLYLYHFVTLLPWRGHGFYPRLLRDIVQRTANTYERFWIIHRFVNTASKKGIAKAGFRIACRVFSANTGGLVLVPDRDQERARAGAKLLGLPLLE